MLEQTRWGLICWKGKKNRNCDLQTKYRATVKVVFTIDKLQMGHGHFHLDHPLGLPHLLSLRTLGRCNARMLTARGEVAFSSLLWRRSGLAALRCSKGDGGTAVGEQRGNHTMEMSTPHWSEYILRANVSPLLPGRPTRLPWVWGCRGSEAAVWARAVILGLTGRPQHHFHPPALPGESQEVGQPPFSPPPNPGQVTLRPWVRTPRQEGLG